MRWLFLRGAVPKDRDPKEIEHASLADDDDMWMHIFAELSKDGYGRAIYYGASEPKRFHYSDNFEVWHIESLDSIADEWDCVFARGGFPVYEPVMLRIGGKKIYYGAGKRFCPPANRFCDYDLVLVDSQRQFDAVESVYPRMNIGMLAKPAAPLFQPVPAEKKFDVCFVAGVPNPCKKVEWVYDTVPKDISVLQLGYTPESHPDNVTIRRVPRWEMPDQICQCTLGIVPYGENDSGPRVIPEFIACGVPVITSDDVHWNVPGGAVWTQGGPDKFWPTVRFNLQHAPFDPVTVRKFYTDRYSIEGAAADIRGYLK